MCIELKEVIRRQNKIASDWLINYPARKKAHEERRQELYSKREPAAGLSTGLSKPTETLAIKLADYDLSDDSKWIEVVETVYKMVGYKKQLLIKLRQECQPYVSSEKGGRPSWIAPVQMGFSDKIGWCPHEQVLRDMWHDIINLVLRVSQINKIKI